MILIKQKLNTMQMIANIKNQKIVIETVLF